MIFLGGSCMAFTDTDKNKPVKRVIDGEAYNTATAVLIFHTIGKSEPIQIHGWGVYYPDESELYRTRHGAFFLLKRDVHVNYHDDHGFEDNIEPISDKKAMLWMEEYCQELIEDYFGEVPEAGAKEVRISLRVPSFLEGKAKKIAKGKNLSLNVWLNLVIKGAIDMEKTN